MFLKYCLELFYIFLGETPQFVDAQEKCLGNIPKGANQEHISTSIVDSLKNMKKTGNFTLFTFSKDIFKIDAVF